MNVAPSVPMRPQPRPAPVAWKACEKPGYHAFGNKWWGAFSACEGDVRVHVEAESTNIGGPAVHVAIRTRSCPAGEAAGGGSFDRSVFDRPVEAQLAELKRIVRRSLAEIDETCGGPARSRALLGRQFDEEFRDLARRYWLHLSPADRRKAWGS
jgi:hypothetical protein